MIATPELPGSSIAVVTRMVVVAEPSRLLLSSSSRASNQGCAGSKIHEQTNESVASTMTGFGDILGRFVKGKSNPLNQDPETPKRSIVVTKLPRLELAVPHNGMSLVQLKLST